MTAEVNGGSPALAGDRRRRHRGGADRWRSCCSRCRSSSAAGSSARHAGRPADPGRRGRCASRPAICADAREHRAALEAPFASSWKGAAKPEVVLVEFYDYACPYCKASNPHVDQLLREEKRACASSIVSSRSSGPNSVAAARLSLAASKAGRFSQFHDALYAAGRPAPETNAAAAARGQHPAEALGRPGDRGRAQEELPARRAARRDGNAAVHRRRPGAEQCRRLRRAQESDRGRREEVTHATKNIKLIPVGLSLRGCPVYRRIFDRIPPNGARSRTYRTGRLLAEIGVNAPQSFRGLRVMEIGCGTGARSFEIANYGAHVLGIDPSPVMIKSAEQQRQKLEPDLAKLVSFRQCTIQDIESNGFDVVISENSFEHIIDVPDVLAAIRDKLAPGGRAYIGFGPLYHSPFGDHGWLQANLAYGFLPWSHLILPKWLTYKLVGKKIGRPFTNTIDWPFLALNQHTAADFRRMFVESGLKVICIRHVDHASLAGKVFDILRRVPGLSKYFTDGIYCVLEKARP